jgi:hypothetical protein
MKTIFGIVIGVAFATPITAFATTVLDKITEKASDAELWDGIFGFASEKVSEVTPQILNKTVEVTPAIIETFFG